MSSANLQAFCHSLHVSQSLDPICGKFEKFFGPWAIPYGQMGKQPWQCTTTGIDNSTELQMEKILQAVTEIWVQQIWQPPARLPGPWQYPFSKEGLGVKNMLVKGAPAHSHTSTSTHTDNDNTT